MKELIRELIAAKNIIGSMPATHEAQDMTVAAKAKIMRVAEALEQMDKAKDGEQNGPED